MNKIISILIITILLLGIPGASAGVIDDLDQAIGNGLQKLSQSVQRLSLPGVGSITVRCNAGATCGQSGDNWVISMTSISNAQTIDLELQPGIKSISGDTELTTGASVTIEVTEKAPIQTVPVTLNQNYRYILRDGWLSTINSYKINAYERSSLSSTITTNYDIVLKTADTITNPIHKSYDYRNPETIYLKDNAGNLATITPSHQVSGGITTDVSNVFFVDNGYGRIVAFDKTNFNYYSTKVFNEVQYVNPLYVSSLPKSWPEYLTRMQNLGLVEYTDLPLALQGTNNIIMTYPVGSVGTQLQGVIPKAMARTITVVQNWGDPKIDSFTLSPETIVKGQGLATATVKVTNRGSSDVINVNVADSNGATVTAVTNSMRLDKDQQGTFTFLLNPMVSTTSKVGITVTAVAGGSGYKVSETVYLAVTVPTPGATTQKVSVKAFTPEGSILTNAPIFKNGQQVGTGSYEDTLPLGTYTFGTDNSSNPQYYAPTTAEVILKGGDPQVISLTFSLTPQGQDLTWIFWGALILLLGWVLYRQGVLQSLAKNPMQIVAIIALVFIGYILFAIYQAISGIASWF